MLKPLKLRGLINILLFSFKIKDFDQILGKLKNSKASHRPYFNAKIYCAALHCNMKNNLNNKKLDKLFFQIMIIAYTNKAGDIEKKSQFF